MDNAQLLLKDLARVFGSNHVHSDRGSNLRMLDCISRCKDILNRAIELGYSGITITEHEALTSHIAFMQLVKEYQKEGKLPDGFKVAYGNEIYLVNSIEKCKNREEKFYHFIVTAKDKYGHEILRRLSSTAWSQTWKTGKMRRVPITKEQVESIMTEHNGQGHIQVSTACLGSELAELFTKFKETGDLEIKKEIGRYIKWMINVFGRENVYLEIQATDTEEQVEYNKFLYTLANGYKLPIQITNDVHMIRKEHIGVHEAFLKSKEADRETGDFYKGCYMMTVEEMWDNVKSYLTFEQFKQVIEGTKQFLDGVEQYDLFHPTIVPARDLSGLEWSVQHLMKDWYDKYDYIKKYAYSEYEQDRFYLGEIEKGIINKNIELTEEVVNRIALECEELWLISEVLGERMSSYYNLIQYIVSLMWNVSFVGASRGSVAGWYSAYLMDIHQMNCFKYDLSQFWRHIHHSKVGLPKQYWASIVNLAQGCVIYYIK